ncbi:MFS transporter [Dactylosporangium sp. NPDC006015]|uniref:MFS transporter n=1 Tax=Dactylosporangium sp. NPDC006015 TaxID=3154576 RepID=UPI0033AAABC2
MRTYRQLFRTPEFPALFATLSGQVAAGTVAGIGLGTLVFAATDSPLLSALSMFGASFAQLIGAATLLSWADRVPPRAALTGLAVFAAVTTAVLAVPGLPIAAVFAVVLAQGLAASVGGGVRYGLLAEILPADGYILGRSLLNMSIGAMQILGFAAGGALVAAVSPRGALVAGAALQAVSALIARFGLTARPPRATDRPSVRATWHGNRKVWRPATYIAMWVPNGLIVGCEALFVPYSPAAASILFVAAAIGMLAGDAIAGRFVPPRLRYRLSGPLRWLLAAPYLLFFLDPPLPVAVAIAGVASVGYGATLLLQDRLLATTPESLHGQALGLFGSGLLAMQAVGATLGGLIAQHTPPATAMGILAVGSLLVSTALFVTGRLTKPAEPTPRPEPVAVG